MVRKQRNQNDDRNRYAYNEEYEGTHGCFLLVCQYATWMPLVSRLLLRRVQTSMFLRGFIMKTSKQPENFVDPKDNKTSPRGMAPDQAHTGHDTPKAKRNVEQEETFDSSAQNAQSKQTSRPVI